MQDRNSSVPILVADDSEDDCRLLQRAFRDAKIGNPLVFVHDGQAALEALHGAAEAPGGLPPGLLLLDLKMPRLDGHQTLQSIRADPRLALLPVLVMSTSDYSEDVLACYRLGANAVMVKPFAYEEFLDLTNMLKRFWLDHALLPINYTSKRGA